MDSEKYISDSNTGMKAGAAAQGGALLRHRRAAAALAALVIAAGALVMAVRSGSADATTTVIRDAQAKTGNVAKTISASGTLSDEASINIKVPAGVVVTELCVQTGDKVKKGDLLAKVDRASVAKLILELEEEQDEIEDAIDDLTDADDTSSEDYLKKVVYDSELSDLEDAVGKLRDMLDSGVIKASKAGTVTAVCAEEGEALSSASSGASGNASSGASASTMSASTASASSGASASTMAALVSSAASSSASSTASSISTADYSSTGKYSSLLEAVTYEAVSDTAVVSDLSSLTIAQPSDGALPQTSIASTSSYDAKISWDTSSAFVGGESYTALIELTAKDGYSFADASSYDIGFSGGTLIDGTPLTEGEGSGNRLVIKVRFTAEGKSDENTESSSGNTASDPGSSSDAAGSGPESSGAGSSSGDSSGSAASGAAGKSGSTAGSVRSSGSTSGSSAGTSSSSSDTDSLVESTVDMVTAFQLSSDDEMTVTLSVDEADINSVKKGQTAKVTLDAIEGESFDGEITEVSSVSSSGSGGNVKYKVTVTIDKTEDMKAGMTASAVINIEEAENVTVIPSAAVNEKGGKTYVYTENKDGELGGETEIETGLSNGSMVEVKSGLSEGTTVYYEVREKDSSGSSTENSGRGGMPDMGSMPEMPDGGQGGPGRMPNE